MNFRFHWRERLHRRQDFKTVFREGRRYSAGGLTLWVYRNPHVRGRRARLGLAISRRFGNAVRRNRLKRLLREIFRLHKMQWPPGTDMIFSAKPMTLRLTYQSLETLVQELWKKTRLGAASPGKSSLLPPSA